MKSNLEWKKWGEIDPLYAVATWKGKQRGSHQAWTDEEFYELGRTDWAQFEMQWRQYGLQQGRCLEIGCGAGRVSAHLAKSFTHVTGVDVSQHQLDYAIARIQTANVSFKLTDGIHLPVPSGHVDAVFSVYVFQHFESRADALLVFSEIYRVLVKGGTIMIGLPFYELPDSSLRSIFRPMIAGFERLSDLKAAFNRRLILKGKWRPMMRRLRFEQAWLVNALQGLHFGRIEFRCFEPRVGGDFLGFVFATKSC
jgi:SAM-dependent methyltransferase